MKDYLLKYNIRKLYQGDYTRLLPIFDQIEEEMKNIGPKIRNVTINGKLQQDNGERQIFFQEMLKYILRSVDLDLINNYSRYRCNIYNMGVNQQLTHIQIRAAALMQSAFLEILDGAVDQQIRKYVAGIEAHIKNIEESPRDPQDDTTLNTLTGKLREKVSDFKTHCETESFNQKDKVPTRISADELQSRAVKVSKRIEKLQAESQKLIREAKPKLSRGWEPFLKNLVASFFVVGLFSFAYRVATGNYLLFDSEKRTELSGASKAFSLATEARFSERPSTSVNCSL